MPCRHCFCGHENVPAIKLTFACFQILKKYLSTLGQIFKFQYLIFNFKNEKGQFHEKGKMML